MHFFCSAIFSGSSVLILESYAPYFSFFPPVIFMQHAMPSYFSLCERERGMLFFSLCFFCFCVPILAAWERQVPSSFSPKIFGPQMEGCAKKWSDA